MILFSLFFGVLIEIGASSDAFSRPLCRLNVFFVSLSQNGAHRIGEFANTLHDGGVDLSLK